MSKVQIVWFKDLERWDVKNFLYSLKSNFPLVRLGKYIIENNTKIKPFESPETEFDILGVNNKEGVYFNETLLGSRIKQPYYQVRAEEIFYNPYRVNVGSIGIVPKEFDLKYTSPAYVVFRTNEQKLLSQYLVFVLKSKWFNEHLRANTRGSVRQNLSFNALCELQIPLPPLEIQQEIVNKIQNIKDKIKALQEEEKKLKEEIEAYIYIALGLSKEKPKARQKIFIVSFKNLERWDTTFNQKNAMPFACRPELSHCHTERSEVSLKCHFEPLLKDEKSPKNESDRDIYPCGNPANASSLVAQAQYDKLNSHNDKTPNYPLVPLGEICKFINRNYKEYYKNKNFPYIQIADVAIEGILSHSIIDFDNAPSRAKTLVKTGELIISLTRPNLGAFAIIDSKYNNFVVSSGFAVLDSKNNITNNFIKLYLQSQIGIDNFNSIMSGALYPAISQNDLKQIKIPLPPLEIQQDIIDFVESKRDRIKANQSTIQSLQDTMSNELKELIIAEN